MNNLKYDTVGNILFNYLKMVLVEFIIGTALGGCGVKFFPLDECKVWMITRAKKYLYCPLTRKQSFSGTLTFQRLRDPLWHVIALTLDIAIARANTRMET